MRLPRSCNNSLTSPRLIIYTTTHCYHNLVNPGNNFMNTRFLLSTILTPLILLSPSLNADCLQCTRIQVEHAPNGESHEIYTKKCIAKQKDIDGSHCEYCHCPREQHSINRHPYKMHNGKKIAPQSLEEAYKATREHRK